VSFDHIRVYRLCQPLCPFPPCLLHRQMYTLVSIGQVHTNTAADVIVSMVRMQAPSRLSVEGVCVMPGLTATSKVALETGLQLSVGVGMVALLLCRHAAVSCWRRSRWRHDRVLRRGPSLLQHVATAGQDDAATYGTMCTSVQGAHADSTVIDSRQHVLAPPKHAALVRAAANFGLSAYATLTLGAVKMLHCVAVPGTPPHQRRLFIRASVVCDYTGWQLPWVVLLCALAATPLMLPLAAAWARRAEHKKLSVCPGEGARGAEEPFGGSVREGVRSTLVACYTPKLFWWEAVLMAHRLVRFAVGAAH
jgi:hypothetical protein